MVAPADLRGAHGLSPVGLELARTSDEPPHPLSSQSLYLLIPSGLSYNSPSSGKPPYPSRTDLEAPTAPSHSISSLI